MAAGQQSGIYGLEERAALMVMSAVHNNREAAEEGYKIY